MSEGDYILKASETQTANTYLALRVSCYDEFGTCAASCVVLHRRWRGLRTDFVLQLWDGALLRSFD